MSQEKVNKRKEEKRNRKKIMQKEKRERMLASVLGVVIAAAIVGWAGFSIYSRVEANKPISYTEVNIDAITDYMSGLN